MRVCPYGEQQMAEVSKRDEQIDKLIDLLVENAICPGPDGEPCPVKNGKTGPTDADCKKHVREWLNR